MKKFLSVLPNIIDLFFLLATGYFLITALSKGNYEQATFWQVTFIAHLIHRNTSNKKE